MYYCRLCLSHRLWSPTLQIMCSLCMASSQALVSSVDANHHNPCLASQQSPHGSDFFICFGVILLNWRMLSECSRTRTCQLSRRLIFWISNMCCNSLLLKYVMQHHLRRPSCKRSQKRISFSWSWDEWWSRVLFNYWRAKRKVGGGGSKNTKKKIDIRITPWSCSNHWH